MKRKPPTLDELEQEAAVRVTQEDGAPEEAGAMAWLGDVARVLERRNRGNDNAPDASVLYWLWRARLQRDLAMYVAVAVVGLLEDGARDAVAGRVMGEIRRGAEGGARGWPEVLRACVSAMLAGEVEREGAVVRAVAELYLWESAKAGGA